MTALGDVREAIKATVAAQGFPTFTTVPTTVTPPCVFVAPNEPYLTRQGATFGGEIVRHQVVVVTGRGVNEVAATSLDDMLLRVVDALYSNDEWLVGDVDRPGQITLNGQAYLATAIDVDQEIHREAP